MNHSYLHTQKKQKKFISKRLYAALAMLLVAILLMTGVTYAWFVLSAAPEVANITATLGANGNLEIALATSDHLTALKSNNMYDNTVNSELANGDVLHDNVLWGNLVDLDSSDYGLTTLSMRPAAMNILNGRIADAPISAVTYGTDGRPELLTTDPTNPNIESLGFTGVYNVNKGGYYAGSLSMSMDDLQSGNFNKEEVIQSVLDNRDYGVRIAGLLDYSAGVNADQTLANIDLMLDGYCFAVDMLFRTNAPNANLLLQTYGTQRVDDTDYEYVLDFSGNGSYLEMSEKKLSTAMRVVFADTITGEVFALAQPDLYGRLSITARLDENGDPVIVQPGDDQLIKPLTENQVSAITAWVYLDGMQADNSYANTILSAAMKLNLQFATDIDLNPAHPDGNGTLERPNAPAEEDPAKQTYYLEDGASGDYTIYTIGRDGTRNYELSVTGQLNTGNNSLLIHSINNYPENGIILPSVVITDDFSEYSIRLSADSTPFASLDAEEISVTFAAVKDKMLALNSISIGNLFKIDNMASFVSLNVSALDTSSVTDMSKAFQGMESLVSLNISGWNTKNVTNMSSMFDGCSSLSQLSLDNFETTNVTNMDRMFLDCINLTELDLSNWDLSKASTDSMFENCPAGEQYIH